MSDKTWSLKRTKQCAKCPWRVSTNPHDIPDGYCVEKHKNLENTIAEPGSLDGSKAAMACHETDDAHCVGWLNNQLGIGNNIGLRIQMITCENAAEFQTFGAQHAHFNDTLPQEG